MTIIFKHKIKIKEIWHISEISKQIETNKIRSKMRRTKIDIKTSANFSQLQIMQMRMYVQI